MVEIVQSEIAELLERCGAQPPRYGRGKWMCPQCGRPDLSVSMDKQLFNCFHDGCDFRGGICTLHKRLGIGHEWLSREDYLRQQQAQDAARRLDAAVQTRQLPGPWLTSCPRRF